MNPSDLIIPLLLAGAAAVSALFIFLPCSRQRTEHKDTED